MEVRPQQAVDQLFRGGGDGAAPLQHHPDSQKFVVHHRVGPQEVLRTLEGRQEGAHADN